MNCRRRNPQTHWDGQPSSCAPGKSDTKDRAVDQDDREKSVKEGNHTDVFLRVGEEGVGSLKRRKLNYPKMSETSR